MKKRLVLVGLVSMTLMFGCSQTSTKTKAVLPEGFIEVQESLINSYDTTKFKDIDTGCYYIRSEDYQAVAITQMMIEKDGVTVPYCDK